MATVTNQATLRTAVADWLNRSDLSNAQLDQFIEIGEAKIYEELRVPALEKSVTVTVTNSTIQIPSDFIELIELRKTGEGSCSISSATNPADCLVANGVWTSASKDDDIILQRTDSRNLYASDKHSIANSFARDGGQYVLTNSSGKINASGAYTIKYYASDPAIGSLYVNGYQFRATATSCSELKRQSDGTTATTFAAYTPSNGYGTCTINHADVEKDSWLLNDYEMILYAACSVASEYLGNDEDVARYTRLYLEKLQASNRKAANAELKGANVAMRFQNFQGL